MCEEVCVRTQFGLVFSCFLNFDRPHAVAKSESLHQTAVTSRRIGKVVFSYLAVSGLNRNPRFQSPPADPPGGERTARIAWCVILHQIVGRGVILLSSFR